MPWDFLLSYRMEGAGAVTAQGRKAQVPLDAFLQGPGCSCWTQPSPLGLLCGHMWQFPLHCAP